MYVIFKNKPKIKNMQNTNNQQKKGIKNTLIECWLLYASGKYFMFVQYENT